MRVHLTPCAVVCVTCCFGCAPAQEQRTAAKTQPRVVSTQKMERGKVTVCVVTDGQGKVATVSIIKSSGSAKLDQSTIDYVKGHWHGPANSTKYSTFDFVPSA